MSQSHIETDRIERRGSGSGLFARQTQSVLVWMVLLLLGILGSLSGLIWNNLSGQVADHAKQLSEHQSRLDRMDERETSIKQTLEDVRADVKKLLQKLSP